MGIQNATARRLAVPDLTTTVLTLTLTGIAADSRLAGGTGGHPARRLIAVTAMLTGALLGALLVTNINLVLPLAIAAALMTASAFAARACIATEAVTTPNPETIRDEAVLFPHSDRLDRPRSQGSPRGQRQSEQRQHRRDAEDGRELVQRHMRTDAARQRVAQRQQRRGGDRQAEPEAHHDDETGLPACHRPHLARSPAHEPEEPELAPAPQRDHRQRVHYRDRREREDQRHEQRSEPAIGLAVGVGD